MTNEQQQIIDETYENYCTTLIDSITFSERGKHFKSNGLEFNSGYPNYVHYTKVEFINKCKTDPEFSEKWGLKIEERELSLEERYGLMKKLDNWVEVHYKEPKTMDYMDKHNIPTKLITITYKEQKNKIMENLKIKIIITDGEKEAIASLPVDAYKQGKELHGISLLDDTVDYLLDEIKKSVSPRN
jgi:hypothetical protein